MLLVLFNILLKVLVNKEQIKEELCFLLTSQCLCLPRKFGKSFKELLDLKKNSINELFCIQVRD